MLNGIAEITTDDIEKIQPDIKDLLFDNKANFNDIKLTMTRELYSILRAKMHADYPLDSDDDLDLKLDKIKDRKDEALKTRLIYMIIETVYRLNNKIEKMQIMQDKLKGLQISYYVDEDESNTASYDEIETVNLWPRFGRG